MVKCMITDMRWSTNSSFNISTLLNGKHKDDEY